VDRARPNKHTASQSEARSYDDADLPALLEIRPDPLFLVLDCITDPHNFGACLRTADAAGVTAVVVPKDKSCPVNDTVRRVSCGGADSVPIVRVTNLARAMERMKKGGVWFVGTSDHGQKSIYETDLKGPIAIVMGAEGEGMRRLTEENCDFLVQIPMSGTVECLNVSVATGVCLFEAIRQRLK
jgi:23S rRNA (guanosine2251-2'-O)-methyltransferase